MRRFLPRLLILLLLEAIHHVSLAYDCNRTSNAKMAQRSWILQTDADRSELGFRLFLRHYRRATAFALEQCALYCIKDVRYLNPENYIVKIAQMQLRTI